MEAGGSHRTLSSRIASVAALVLLWCNSLQYCAVQFTTVQHSAVQFNTVQCSMTEGAVRLMLMLGGVVASAGGGVFML